VERPLLGEHRTAESWFKVLPCFPPSGSSCLQSASVYKKMCIDRCGFRYLFFLPNEEINPSLSLAFTVILAVCCATIPPLAQIKRPLRISNKIPTLTTCSDFVEPRVGYRISLPRCHSGLGGPGYVKIR